MITPQSYDDEEEIIQKTSDGKFDLVNVDLLDDVETLRWYYTLYCACNMSDNTLFHRMNSKKVVGIARRAVENFHAIVKAFKMFSRPLHHFLLDQIDDSHIKRLG